ncbi:MAG: nitrate- and nitrite sensing domain-containing protein, partial [Azonexus sp.]|nr:nitrate- and nitrite sensing domain-containing protein [Azonexus sp.]
MAFEISKTHSLKTQLFVVFWALTAALIYYAASAIMTEYRNLQSLDKVADAQQIAIASGALAHELQKERGLSAGYLSSKGQKFRSELSSQRQLTDKVFSAYNQQIAQIDRQGLSATAQEKLSAGADAMALINDKRKDIDSLDLDPPLSFAYYSSTIDQLLDMVTESGKISTQDLTSKALSALDLFLRSKENAGRERAVVNGIFSANQPVTSAQFRSLSSVVAAQAAYSKLFLAVADSQRKQDFEQLLSGQTNLEVERLRGLVFARATEGNFGVDAPFWFKTITEKIDAMKGIEDHLVADLSDKSATLVRQARFSLALAIAAIALGLVFNGLFLWVMFRLVRGLRSAQSSVDQLAQGNFSTEILVDRKDELGAVQSALADIRQVLVNLDEDTQKLVRAAIAGRLSERADTTRHHGEYRQIVEGINQTLDAVIAPLNVAANYVERISRGDIPPKITDTYNGDFNTIKNNLNICIDALNGLINEMNTMSKEHDKGDIDVRIHENDFQGAYQTMAKGVNEMVFGHIAVKKKAMACVKAFGDGDMDAPLETFPGKKRFINDTIEQVRRNIKALVEDANSLSVAAVAGKLDTRADAARHLGDFRRIVQGVNDTLDAVVGPIRDVQRVMAA